MDESLLARLPPELRDQIYEHVLYHPEPLTVQLSSGKPQLSQPYGSRPLALAQTCRLIRHESLPMFYQSNHFSLQTDHIKTYHFGYGLRTSWLSTLRDWLDLIGDRNRRQLRDVDIDILDWDVHFASSNGHTAKLVWDSLTPAMDFFDVRTRLSLRCEIIYHPFELEHKLRTAELRLSVLDADVAEKDVRTFFKRYKWYRRSPFPTENDREHECLRLVELIRERGKNRNGCCELGNGKPKC